MPEILINWPIRGRSTRITHLPGGAGLTYLFSNGIAPYANYSPSFLPTPDPNDPFFRSRQTGEVGSRGVEVEGKS